jgi:hypothetical protein
MEKVRQLCSRIAAAALDGLLDHPTNFPDVLFDAALGGGE